MTLTLFGIKNCDTVRKAMKWLDEEGVLYDFHDFRHDGITDALAADFYTTIPLDALINKRSTTWRNLDNAQKETVENSCETSIISLIVSNPTLIKRPVWRVGSDYFTGFTSKEKLRILS